MRLILAVILLFSFSALAQELERCTVGQIENTRKNSKKICNDHVKEFADRSSASCAVSKYDSTVCLAECKDENMTALAKVSVEMKSDCGREVAYYSKTVIKYYR